MFIGRIPRRSGTSSERWVGSEGKDSGESLSLPYWYRLRNVWSQNPACTSNKRDFQGSSYDERNRSCHILVKQRMLEDCSKTPNIIRGQNHLQKIVGMTITSNGKT